VEGENHFVDAPIFFESISAFALNFEGSFSCFQFFDRQLNRIGDIAGIDVWPGEVIKLRGSGSYDSSILKDCHRFRSHSGFLGRSVNDSNFFDESGVNILVEEVNFVEIDVDLAFAHLHFVLCLSVDSILNIEKNEN
jgi:hypothetical protein